VEESPRSGCEDLDQRGDQRDVSVVGVFGVRSVWRVGFQNSAMASDQRFQAAGSCWLISPPRTGRCRTLPPGPVGRRGHSWCDLPVPVEESAEQVVPLDC